MCKTMTSTAQIDMPIAKQVQRNLADPWASRHHTSNITVQPVATVLVLDRLAACHTCWDTQNHGSPLTCQQ